MNYIKRSLVGLFTLLIIPSGGAQAANNTPYPFGDEFVYQGCPDGLELTKWTSLCYQKPHMGCDKNYTLKGDICTVTLMRQLRYKCPAGYNENYFKACYPIGGSAVDKDTWKERVVDCSPYGVRVGNHCADTKTRPIREFCNLDSPIDMGKKAADGSYCKQGHPGRRSPVEEIMATLYPRYSNDTEQQQSAAFRYLDSM
ncbi:hypothetical protein AB4258_22365, partial [Vibrio splendidus]